MSTPEFQKLLAINIHVPVEYKR